MKIVSIINLKGGVAKTLTADNMAHVLAVFHKKRVLLVDNDKQGNTSKAFGVHSYDEKSLSDVLTARRLDVREVIKKTRFENIDVLPANMTLIRANMEVLMDTTRPQQTRLRAALDPVSHLCGNICRGARHERKEADPGILQKRENTGVSMRDL